MQAECEQAYGEKEQGGWGGGAGGDLPLLNNESWSNVDVCNYGVGPSLTIIIGRKAPLFPFLPPPTLIKTLEKNAARIDFDRPAYWIGAQEGQFPVGRPFWHHFFADWDIKIQKVLAFCL